MSGNVWMFSDELDDEDIEFIKHEFVIYNMATDYYGLGIKPVREPFLAAVRWPQTHFFRGRVCDR